MSEFLRSTKVLIGTLLVGLIGLGLRYAQNWTFDPVEVAAAPVVLVPDKLAPLRTSVSPARKSVDEGHCQWKICVVTNRSFTDGIPVLPAGLSHVIDELPAVIQFVPETTYGFSDVCVPLQRSRGAFCLDSAQPEFVRSEQLRKADSTAFFDGVRRLLDEAPTRDVLVFVHGFNVSLEQATARAAQIAEDMPFHGVMVAYSWASAAQQVGYSSDSLVAERYFWNLAALLADLRNQLPPDTRLHVLAHSMGNRVTLRALNALTGTIGPLGEDTVLNPERTRERFEQWGAWSPDRLPSPPLSNLILAAPDVEVNEFEGFVSAVRHLTQSTVLYASDSDMALEGSLHFNGEGHRAGDSRAHVDVAGLRVIHVSGVNRLDPLGHSYYGSNPGVLDQLAQLLRPVSPAATLRPTIARDSQALPQRF